MPDSAVSDGMSEMVLSFGKEAQDVNVVKFGSWEMFWFL